MHSRGATHSNDRNGVNNATTALGENVYLLGNVVELGNWDTSKAIGPMFNSTDTIGVYPTWFYDVSVPVGYTIEYKFVKIDSSGNITWIKALITLIRFRLPLQK